MIRTPYLLFLGDAPDQLAAKVAQGIKDWRPENVVGQFRMEGCQADIGVTDMSLAEAWEKGARTLVIGVANRGGVISKEWQKVLTEALDIGYDLASGLHNLLRDEPELNAIAAREGRALHDGCRRWPIRLPTGRSGQASGVWPWARIAQSAKCIRAWRWTPRCASGA